MSIGKLMKDVKAQVKEHDLQYLQDFTTEEKQKDIITGFGENNDMTSWTLADIESGLLEVGLPIDNIVLYQGFPSVEIAYWSGGIYLPFDKLILVKGVEAFPELKKELEKLENLSPLDLWLHMEMANNKGLGLVAKHLFPKLPDEEKTERLLSVYASLEYGHDFIDASMWEEAKRCRTEDQWQEVAALPEEDGLVRIYRGEAAESTPIDQARSWTTSLQTASYFATRYMEEDDTGRLFVSRVPKDTIFFVLHDRNEEEVIVDPKAASEKAEVLHDFPSLSREVQRVSAAPWDNLFNQGKSILGTLPFKFPDGDHGKQHTKRVSLLTLTLATEMNLSRLDTETLFFAALLHDVGRETEDEEPGHGEKSWAYMNENHEIMSLYQQHLNIQTLDWKALHFLITTHDLPDDERPRFLAKLDPFPDEKERLLRLSNTLKDADALDRVRLGDLDIRFLRTAEAVSRLHVARAFYKNIQ